MQIGFATRRKAKIKMILQGLLGSGMTMGVR